VVVPEGSESAPVGHLATLETLLLSGVGGGATGNQWVEVRGQGGTPQNVSSVRWRHPRFSSGNLEEASIAVHFLSVVLDRKV
jgi:hypothetical protein